MPGVCRRRRQGEKDRTWTFTRRLRARGSRARTARSRIILKNARGRSRGRGSDPSGHQLFVIRLLYSNPMPRALVKNHQPTMTVYKNNNNNIILFRRVYIITRTYVYVFVKTRVRRDYILFGFFFLIIFLSLGDQAEGDRVCKSAGTRHNVTENNNLRHPYNCTSIFLLFSGRTI